MKTITIQVGNSDGKLTQGEWCSFVWVMQGAIDLECSEVHFASGSPSWSKWQNFCWVVDVDTESYDRLKDEVRRARKEYRQHSAAWTEGQTEFI